MNSNQEEEEEPTNTQALLVGLSRFAPGSPGDSVVFGPRLPRRDAHQEATGREEP